MRGGSMVNGWNRKSWRRFRESPLPDETPTGGHIALGPGSEFDFVRTMLRGWRDSARGIGDDAAVLDVGGPSRIVVSTDTAIENIHFREAWLTPREIGYRSTTAALSDLAAMAARPVGLLLALGVPDRWRERIALLALGVGDAAGVAGALIVGGDVSRASELSVGVTAIGTAPAPVTRDGASAGDHVYVTGRLGGAADALRAWERGEEPAPWSRDRFVRPVARLREALWLAERGVHALIDISDGLASELRHLAAASQVELHIDIDRVPVGDGLAITDALTAGEEYELLATAPVALDLNAFAAEFGVPLTEIGIVAHKGHAAVLASSRGVRVDLPRGHDHFTP
jgi:thiamine-monophosphate kinase